MIVQRRRGGLRLIDQHEHGLLAGEMALAWSEANGEPEVSEILVTATALHDLGWRPLDRRPRWDASTRRPMDFQAFPSRTKFEAAAQGIELIEELDDYAALLVSLHYASFAGAPDWFVEGERTRQDELASALRDELPEDEAIETDLRLLQLFDVLSLSVCMTHPDAATEDRPPWLGDQFDVAGWDDVLTVAWRGDVLTVDPWPFGEGELGLRVPYRNLLRDHFDGQSGLDAACQAATAGEWPVTLSSL